MKRNLLRMTVTVVAMTLAVNVNAQFDLKNVLGNVLESTSNSANKSGDNVISNLTSVFSSDKQAKENNIIGTWVYSEPAIVFSSDNLLAKAAAKIASNKVEKKLQGYLTQYGIAPGSFSMTFNEDGTFTETLKGKTINGTWKIEDSKLKLTIAKLKTVAITTQIDGKDMQFVTDATKLLNMFKTFGAQSNNSSIKTVASLMKSVNGMQAGITLRVTTQLSSNCRQTSLSMFLATW